MTHLQSDKIVIEDFEYTPQVTTGGKIGLSYNIFGDSPWVTPEFGTVFQNPDYCITGNLGAGFRVKNRVLLEGEGIETNRWCWPDTNRQQRQKFDVQAPAETGTYSLYTEVVSFTDEELLAQRQVNVEVIEGETSTSCPKGFEYNPETGACEIVQDEYSPNPNDGIGSGGGDGVQQTLNKGLLALGGILAIRAIGFLEGD
jgi:hypothetical protein